MRIGIDYRVAVAHAPGVGRYMRELSRALAPLAGEGFGLALLELGMEPRAMDEEALGLAARDGALRRVRAPIPRSWAAPLARWTGLDANRWLGGVDLFHHARSPLLPLRGTRATMAVAELPERGSSAEGEFAERLAALDGMLVFSAHYERELAERFGLDPARIHRTAVGCEHWARALASAPDRADPPEIVVLGAIARRRHPLAALHAFERLAAGGRDARLVYLGRPNDAARELAAAIERSPVRERVAWEREPREREMSLRVARAACLLHLSDDEGTPVTPLEAFALGVPVVASELPAFVEALGGEARFVANAELGSESTSARSRRGAAQEELGSLVRALDASLESNADSDACARRRALAARFTWRRCALETLDAWRAVLARCAR